jgi:hypothetical protein
MQLNRLADLIEEPEVHRKILKDYAGGYSLGITSNPRRKGEWAIRVRVEGDDVGDIPEEIELDGEPVPIVVNTNFKIPEPYGKT